jgi:hypothetical protein
VDKILRGGSRVTLWGTASGWSSKDNSKDKSEKNKKLPSTSLLDTAMEGSFCSIINNSHSLKVYWKTK